MNAQIEKYLKEKGMSLVGFADLSALPAEPRRGFPRAVSMAVALDAGVVARIPQGPILDYDKEYAEKNKQLDAAGLSLEEFLRGRGYGAFALTRGRFPYSAETGYQTPLPHKTAARLAGLGWVGKGAVLVTRQYGTAVRLTTVLTDAPVVCGAPLEGRGCGNCTACREACPAGAIYGEKWSLGTSRDSLVDVVACDKEVEKRRKGTEIAYAACGLCLAACPYTKKYLENTGGS